MNIFIRHVLLLVLKWFILLLTHYYWMLSWICEYLYHIHVQWKLLVRLFCAFAALVDYQLFQRGINRRNATVLIVIRKIIMFLLKILFWCNKSKFIFLIDLSTFHGKIRKLTYFIFDFKIECQCVYTLI